MKRSITVMTTSLALLILGLAFSVGTAVAQSAKDLVGTWTPVSAEVFGPNPKGNLTFDANGRFSLQLLRADLKKIAANKRDMGTPEENNAIVHGSISYYGTYTMNGTELVLHVEASSFPNWTGTDQKRTNVSLTADQLTYTNPAPSVGPGTPTILVWKRTPAVRTD
jgi:Lipocalin-like domain